MAIALESMDETVLPLVSKPGQYLSLLPESLVSRLAHCESRLCVLDPRPLSRALTSPELHGLVASLHSQLPDSIGLDLALAPTSDVLDLLEPRALPAFALGGHQTLAGFDVLLVCASQVEDLPMAVHLLRSAGIPVLAADRGPEHPLVLLAGPVAIDLNACAPWFDATLVGDPEAFVTDLARWSGARRGFTTLEQRTTWAEEVALQGSVVPWTHMHDAAFKVSARWGAWSGLTPESLLIPVGPGQALDFPVAIARYGPDGPRFRSWEDAAREIEFVVAATGCGDILLAGPQAARHPDLIPLLDRVNRRFDGHDVSLRVESVSLHHWDPPLARELHKGSRHQLTFDPVACSARLRQAANAPLDRDAFLAGADLARRGGWGGLQFQIEVGRPGETPADLDEGLETLEAVRAQQTRAGSAPRMSVILVPFVPSAEDEAGDPCTAERLEEIAALWRQRWRTRRMKVSTAPVLSGHLRTALRRSPAPDQLMDALLGLPSKRLADLAHLDPGLWPDSLISGQPVQSARGLSHPVVELLGEELPDATEPGQGSSITRNSDATETVTEFGPPTWMVGRKPRRAGPGRSARQSERYRVRFSKAEPLRFTSHLDVTRAFDRAFRRTQLPVAQSQGKDRKPKVSYGPPLPLGMTSAAEYFDIAFSREVPESFTRILNEALPDGLAVVAAAPVRTEADSLNAAIQIAEYEVSFSDSLIRDYLADLDFDSLKDRLDQEVASALAANTLEVTRVRGESSKTFNARPSLLRAGVLRDDGGRPVLGLRLTLNLPDSVRPETLTSRLCSWANFDERLLRVHRGSLLIPGRKNDLDPLEVVAPDFAWWRHPVRGGTVI